MLTPLQPRKSALVDSLAVDALLQPLLAAAAAGGSLESAMEGVLRDLGFDSFMYGLSTDPRPSHDSRTYCWTTQPREWVVEYDRNAYVEVDPRITQSCGRSSPMLWDAATIRGGPRVRRFLDHAARYGIRSGVVVPISDGSDSRIGVLFNSAVSPVDAVRHAAIVDRLPTLMLFGVRFHDHFMTRVVNRGMAAGHRGAPLSPRERQCLALAAHGMTSPDIGFKLGITERTANFHFGNIISKLGVLNRQEAIAKAISQGTIRL